MAESKLSREVYIFLIIISIAALLRISLLGLHRLHMDECLYSSYAVRMITHGDLGLNGGLHVDKPPLFFYALAASFLTLGITENAARIPNIIFSIVTLVFIFRLVKRMYSDSQAAILAVFFAGLSVYYTLFSVTAFQDISMMMLFVMSLYYLTEKRVFLSSLLYFFSILAKPMTLFLFPVYAYFWVSVFGFWLDKKATVDLIRSFLFTIIPLFLWSALLANPRFGVFKFFITQQPEAMSVSLNVIDRFNIWAAQSQYVLNGHFFIIIAIAGIACLSVIKRNKYDIFVLFSIIFIYAILTLVKFRQYDRYLIILVPFAAIALARCLSWVLLRIANSKLRITAITVLCLLYLIPAYNLPSKNMKSGALYDDADGFDNVAAFLISKENKDTSVFYYGHTISWYGYFYLAERKFKRAEPVYDLKRAQYLAGKGDNYILVDTTKTQKNIVDYFNRNFKTAFIYYNERRIKKYILYII